MYCTLVPALKPPKSRAAVVSAGCAVVVGAAVVDKSIVVVELLGSAVVVSLVGGRQDSILGYCGPDQQLGQLV
jgi:hypothetical protein